jgi:uncharacterized membrane protein YbhN (UPF0104 family)
MKNENISKIFKLSISILIVGYLSTILDWSILTSLEIGILPCFIAGLVFLLIAIFFMAIRWNIIIQHEVQLKVPLLTLYRFYLIGSFFNSFLPSSIGGDIVRVKYSSHLFSLSLKRATAIVVSERFFGLAALSALFSIGFFINQELTRKLGLASYFSLIAIAGACIIFCIAKYLAEKKIKISFTFAFLLLILSACGQFADILIVFLLASYFELSISISSLMIVMPLVFIATIAPISLGGLGVREGTMVALLSFLNVNTSIAIILAFSLYLSKLVVGLIGAYLYNKKNEIIELKG